MKLVLPWWFPLPDAVVKATFQAGIRYMTLGLHCIALKDFGRGSPMAKQRSLML